MSKRQGKNTYNKRSARKKAKRRQNQRSALKQRRKEQASAKQNQNTLKSLTTVRTKREKDEKEQKKEMMKKVVGMTTHRAMNTGSAAASLFNKMMNKTTKKVEEEKPSRD